jgi:hypothetical protein
MYKKVLNISNYQIAQNDGPYTFLAGKMMSFRVHNLLSTVLEKSDELILTWH